MPKNDFEPYVRCDRCQVDTPTKDMYWNEDYAPMCEDYILPPAYESVCSSCFELLLSDGTARWKTQLELANRK
tara:strand:+ start:255 stop:473 length:219 start_codon:yes stop_codon:yes gene_type:complete